MAEVRVVGVGEGSRREDPKRPCFRGAGSATGWWWWTGSGEGSRREPKRPWRRGSGGGGVGSRTGSGEGSRRPPPKNGIFI